MGKREMYVGNYSGRDLLRLGSQVAALAAMLFLGGHKFIEYMDAFERTYGLSPFSSGKVFAAEKEAKKGFQFDAVAVLSSGANRIPPECQPEDKSEQFSVGKGGTLRIDAALYAVHLGLTDTVVMIGGMGGAPVPDARIMDQVFYKRAKELKIDVSKVRVLNGEWSEHTNENLEELKQISTQYGLRKVLLDTNDFHLFNSILLGTTYGNDVYAFNPEQKLPQWYPEYAEYIQKLRNAGEYDRTSEKEFKRLLVMFFNPDLKAAEVVWDKAHKVIDVFVAIKHTDQPKPAVKSLPNCDEPFIPRAVSA